MENQESAAADDRAGLLQAEGEKTHSLTYDQLKMITGSIVAAAIRVHSKLGPGLLESAYQACLAHELRIRGHRVTEQVEVPVIYSGIRIDIGYRIDLLVDECVIVELKAIARIHPIHEAQILSHLKLSNRRVGLLINFHEIHLKDGIRRFVND